MASWTIDAMPAATPAPTPPDAMPAAVFRPRLTLRTLSRGDGLLGMKPGGKFGPRGEQVSVVEVDWTYRAGAVHWAAPAPLTILNSRAAPLQLIDLPDGGQFTLRRDLAAEAEAMDRLWTLGLYPVPPESLQWRSEQAAIDGVRFWSLLQEDHFGDFWADRLPELQAEGWVVVVRPGFAHESVPVDGWRVVLRDELGEVVGREVATTMRNRPPVVDSLHLPAREGSWLLTLGVDVAGETLDLAPMMADLLRRDRRWFDRRQVAAIDDTLVIRLRAPGGRRIEAPAGLLKAIVGTMLDLLAWPDGQPPPPMRLSAADGWRLAAIDMAVARAGLQGAWHWQGDAGLRRLGRRLAEAGSPRAVQPPEGLHIDLRPYQLHGLAWLQYLREQQLGGILADDMGLGKTAQALAHLLLEKQQGRALRPSLVVVPSSLVFNWQAEAARMAPGLKVLALQGPGRHADFARMAQHHLVLTTYPLLWRDIDALARQDFHLLILDEAQFVKNAASRGARALRRLRAAHRLCLTGTPLENHLGELWAQFDFLMPGFLGDSRSFTRLWRKPIEVNGESQRAQLLAQRVRPFVLRRRKDEVATELPPRSEVVKRLQLQGKQRELYESVRVAADLQVRRVLERSGFDGGQISILGALLKLRQVCCDPFLLDGVRPARNMPRAKLELLRLMLPELLAEGRRILVFSQFTGMLKLIEAELDELGIAWLALTGETAPGRRGAVVRQFQDRQVPVLLVSLKAGGVGLNLTAADTVIHVDPWWNPAVEQQATARAHRIGQDQPVFVYKLVVEGSIEERLLELQARKSRLTEGILGSDAAGASKFTPEDLRALLAPLAPDAGLLPD